MATKVFVIPSLFTGLTWRVEFKDDKAKWEQLWKLWRGDNLLDVSEADRAIQIGKPETVADTVGHPNTDRFEVPLARSSTHHERPGVQNAHRKLYNLWGWSASLLTRPQQELEYGIYRRSGKPDLWLQLRPLTNNMGKSNYIEVPHTAGLAPNRLQPESVAYSETHSFFHELEEEGGGKPRQPWYMLWRTSTKYKQVVNDVYDPASAFDALNLALREVRGTQFAGRPFHGLVPSFHPVKASFDPLTLVELSDRSVGAERAWGTRLVRMDLGDRAADQEMDARVDWFYSDRDGTDNAITGFTLRGKIDADGGEEQFQRRWGENGTAIFGTFNAMLDACKNDKDDGKRQRIDDKDEGKRQCIVDFKLKGCKLVGTPNWIRLGSVEIFPVNSEGCTLSFKAHGHLGTGATAIYPKTSLGNLRCHVRNAAGADPEREIARIDELSDDLDTLSRETTPIVGKIDDESFRMATLTMDTTYQWGRDARTVITIVVDNADELKGAAVWLNLRPFMAALVDFPRTTNEQLSLSWSSDDKDGAQWRVDQPLVSVILPPQAVGEEMERGDRFYESPDLPDIDPKKPVPYRFSRGTYLKLRPSNARENRRFEISPINLREVIRGSRVEGMVVEMAYPLEVRYERREDSTRDIQLIEAGEFFGVPSKNLSGDNSVLKGGSGLSKAMKAFLLDNPLQADAYLKAVLAIVGQQTAVQLNFVSRLAELHLKDPLRERGDLRLGGNEVTAYLRHTDQGAKPLISPLPNDSLFTPSPTRGSFGKFLDAGDWGAPSKGAIRGGLIHSFELPSELVEVLDTPVAVAKMIDALSLSAIGATGRMEASFASGKTSFGVVVEHGQLSRLVKTRIGRVGALWNRAKHVVVYERTAARSAQFATEQGNTRAFDKWPILRKAEEYIEPIQVRRNFHEEEQKDSNATRFIAASVFETKRVFVNGAWARDLGVGEGYELPLWDRTAAQVTPRFYPRPKLFLDCYGEDDKLTRLWFRDPDCIFFFSSAAKGTDADTDRWNSRSGVDFDNLPRLTLPDEMPRGTPANKELCTSRRFDLAVEAEGRVNLAYGSGGSPQFVKLDRIYISRSSQTSPVNADPQTKAEIAPVINAIKFTGDAQRSAARLAPTLAELSDKLKDRIEREIYSNSLLVTPVANPCLQIKSELKLAVDAAIKDLKESLDPAARLDLAGQIQRTKAMWLAAAGELDAQLQSRALFAQHVVETRVQEFVKSLDKLKEKIPDNAGDLTPELVRLKNGLLAEVKGLEGDLRTRVKEHLDAVVSQVSAALSEAVKATDVAAKTLEDATKDFERRCRSACGSVASAVGTLEKLPAASRKLLDAAANWLRFLSEQLAALADAAKFVRALAPNVAADIVLKLSKLAEATSGLAKNLSSWAETQLKKAAAEPVVAEVTAIADMLARHVSAIDAATPGNVVRAELDKLRRFAVEAGDNVLARHKRAVASLGAGLAQASETVAAALSDPSMNPLQAIAEACAKVTAEIGKLADTLRVQLHNTIDQGAAQCNDLMRSIRKELAEAEAWAQRQADAALTNVLSSEAAQQMAQYAQTATKVWDVGSKAVSLAQAVGELPRLTPLNFDIDIAAYVFDGKKPGIAMTPAIAKLQRQGEELLESLGLSVPCKELSDRLIPDLPAGLDFNDVFNKFAGIDFKGLFERFTLPKLDSENVKISHGFDPKTRRAWVNTNVSFAHPQYEELFAFGPVALGLERMKLDAFTGVETRIVGTSVQTLASKTNASLKADWLLQGAGQPLVTFKEVTIKYDGADGFGFDVSPNKIELHPSLKFISEFVAQFKGDLPPAIQIEEENGRPVGVNAGTTIVLDDLPDLGGVTIGPIDMRSSLGLRLEGGRFVISSAFSLGNKQKPIFVQITWLGGGFWLEARAKYVDGVVVPSISVGVSVGAIRAFNLAGVAKGSFSVQLYCYIEIQRDDDSVAIGLSIVGSALIIGFVNANLSLLLEAKHSKGKTEGTGRLDVSVKISWFYTFRHKQAVKHTF